MKKTKRIAAIVLCFAMILGLVPGLVSRGYAVDANNWKVEFYANGQELTKDAFYDYSKYSVKLYKNNELQTSSSNITNYPKFDSEGEDSFASASHVVFGPFVMDAITTFKWGDDTLDCGNVTGENTAESVYKSNKDAFADEVKYYKLDDTNYYVVIPKRLFKPTLVVTNGKVYQDVLTNASGSFINFACIPEEGYRFESYYYLDSSNKKRDIDGSMFTVPVGFNKTLLVSARCIETDRELNPYRKNEIDRIVELLNIQGEDVTKFENFVRALPDHYSYKNYAKLLLDWVRPLYKEFYNMGYVNDTQDVDSIKEYVNNWETKKDSLHPSTGLEDDTDAKALYAKEIAGALMLSYYATLENPSADNKLALSSYVMYDALLDFADICNQDGVTNSDISQGLMTVIERALYILDYYIGDEVSLDIKDGYETSSPIYNLIFKLDSEDFDEFENDIERYQYYARKFFDAVIPDPRTLDDEEWKVYGNLDQIIDEEVFKWALRNDSYRTIYNDIQPDKNFSYEEGIASNIQELVDGIAPLQTDAEKDERKVLIIKEQLKLLTREFCDIKALYESVLYINGVSEISSIFADAANDCDLRAQMEILMGALENVRHTSSGTDNKPYLVIYDADLYGSIIGDGKITNKLLTAYINAESGFDGEVEYYYNLLRKQMEEAAKENKVIIEVIDGIYDDENLDKFDLGVFYEDKDGNRTKIPVKLDSVEYYTDLKGEKVIGYSKKQADCNAEYKYNFKINYDKNIDYPFEGVAYGLYYHPYAIIQIDSMPGTSFTKEDPYDVIYGGDTGFSLIGKARRSMTIEIPMVPFAKYSNPVESINDYSLTDKKVKIKFSDADTEQDDNVVEFPYTVKLYGEDGNVATGNIEEGTNYTLVTEIDYSASSTDDVFAEEKLGVGITDFEETLPYFDASRIILHVYEDNDLSKTCFSYSRHNDGKIIKVEVDKDSEKIIIKSFLPIEERPEIEEISFVSNTSDSITFRVKGTNLQKTYAFWVVNEDKSFEWHYSTDNSAREYYNYMSFEPDQLLELVEVKQGEEQLLTYKLSGLDKRVLGHTSFPQGNYKAYIDAWSVSKDGKGSEVNSAFGYSDEIDFSISYASSKTYKAKDESKTAEKISGSGKKGSKRTITPIDGKKVGRVTVTDKNGNKVEVTKNEDGTYSFIQPASDVNVEVTYVNREITLNIGSTEASVDGERSNLDVCPVIRNDRTMLPIRFVAENLGAKVEWSEKNPNYVLITKGDIKIEITLGSDIMKVNGKDVKLDSVAFAENDRTYLPVRAVSENLNAIVEWNEARPMEVKIYER